MKYPTAAAKWLVIIGIGVSMLGAPAVAKAEPIVEIGALSFYEYHPGVSAVFSIFNSTDTPLSGTLLVEGGLIPSYSVLALAGAFWDSPELFDFAAVTRGSFSGTLLPFHLPSDPTLYVPVGLAMGALPDNDVYGGSVPLGGLAPIAVEVKDIAPIPEPASLTLLGSGMVFLLARARSRARRLRR